MDLNEQFIDEFADIFKALSHPTRLCIVKRLYENEEGLNVTSIQKCVDISQSSVSQHLRILKQYNILDSERHGTEIQYILVNDKVRKLIEAMIKLA